MKKTLIASAVAAATLAGNASAMDNKQAQEIFGKLEAMPTVYGSIELVQNYTDDGSNEKSTFGDNGSTLGIKHKHEISPGVEAFLKAEFEFTANTGSGIAGFDEAYIGAKGDFGKVWIGSDDTAYENIDVIDYSENTGLQGELAKVQENNTLHYATPDMGGLSAHVTLILDDATEGASQGHVGTFSVSYALDNINVTGAYAAAEGDGEDAFGLAVTADMGDFTVGGQFESMDETTMFGVMAMMTSGANQFAAAVAMHDYDGNEQLGVAAQALHNVSDNLYTYVEVAYNDLDSAPDPTLDLALGVTYGF